MKKFQIWMNCDRLSARRSGLVVEFDQEPDEVDGGEPEKGDESQGQLGQGAEGPLHQTNHLIQLTGSVHA